MDDKIIAGESTLLRDVLVGKFGWAGNAFGKSDFATINHRNQQQVFQPRTKLLHRLVGGTAGREIPIVDAVPIGSYLKFCIPDAETQRAFGFVKRMDLGWWRGLFDREARYSTTALGPAFERWVRYRGPQTSGFDFDVEYIDGDVIARIPTLVFTAVGWIRIATHPISSRDALDD